MLDDLPTPTISADRMRDAADGVLNQPEYLEAAKPPSLTERLFDAVLEFFGDVFGSLTTFGGRGLFAWVIIALFIGAILFMVTRFRMGSGQRLSPAAGPTIEVNQELTADQWRSEATAHETAGDWRSGLRCRHRALLTELIDRNAISARPGQTAGEAARIVAQRVPSARPSIEAATRLFSDIWYGGSHANEQSRNAFENHAATVIAAVDTAVDTEPATGALSHAAAVPV